MLVTDLYTKPTDRNGLLHFSSCHLRHIKRAVPKSQYTRVQRIVSDPVTHATHLNQMTEKFEQKGYPQQILNSSPVLTRTQIRDKSRRIPFVNMYHPIMPIIKPLDITGQFSLKATLPLASSNYPPPHPHHMCTKRLQNL